MAIVEFKDVSRVYVSGDHELKALDDVNLKLEEGKFVVILGPSGAGKSTLLNLLGGLDSPTSGKIYVQGKDISTLTRDQLADRVGDPLDLAIRIVLIPDVLNSRLLRIIQRGVHDDGIADGIGIVANPGGLVFRAREGDDGQNHEGCQEDAEEFLHFFLSSPTINFLYKAFRGFIYFSGRFRAENQTLQRSEPRVHTRYSTRQTIVTSIVTVANAEAVP